MPKVIIDDSKELEQGTFHIYQAKEKSVPTKNRPTSDSVEDKESHKPNTILKVRYLNDKGDVKEVPLQKFLGEEELKSIEKDIASGNKTISNEILQDSIIVNCSHMNKNEVKAITNLSERLSTQITHIINRSYEEKDLGEKVEKKIAKLQDLNHELKSYREAINENNIKLQKLKDQKYTIIAKTLIPKKNSVSGEVITYKGFVETVKKGILQSSLDLQRKCRETSLFIIENQAEFNFAKTPQRDKLSNSMTERKHVGLRK